MSSRERWTVYPLLFLTLGMTLKDKVTRQINTDRIECKTLLVTDRQGNPRVIVAPTDDGGIVQTVAAKPSVNAILGHYNSRVGLMLIDSDNKVFPLAAPPLRQQPNRAPKDDSAEEPRASPKMRDPSQPDSRDDEGSDNAK